MFPKYQVLDRLAEECRLVDVDGYYIVGVQHIIESTGSLFEALLKCGFKPNNIFLTGKIYSTHGPTSEKLKELGINFFNSTIPDRLGFYSEFLENDVKKMWSVVRNRLGGGENIIVLDDGGYAIKTVPDEVLTNHQVFGLEQTTSGLRIGNLYKRFPVINVAASAAKLYIEPPIISEAIKIRLGEIISRTNPQRMGIVGYGHIGKAITQAFEQLYNVSVYDSIVTREEMDMTSCIRWCTSLEEIYSECDLIIGATGQDISSLSTILDASTTKTLISVSSGDIEFNTILRYINAQGPISDPLDTISLVNPKGHKVNILRGGLVANFTGAADSSPGNIIQMTRGLLFSAVMQIVQSRNISKDLTGAIMLSPIFQAKVIRYWFADQPQRKNDYPSWMVEGFMDTEWIQRHSEGTLLPGC